MSHRFVVLGVVLGGMLLSPSFAAAKPLKLTPRTAVPGQVIVIKGKGLKRATVTIGGRKATIVNRSARRLAVQVPALGPGRKAVVVRARGHRLRTRVRVKAPPKPLDLLIDRGRAGSALIGPAGGTVSAQAANGTAFALTIPAGALPAGVTITLTPAGRVKGVGDDAYAVEFAPEGLVLQQPAELRITPSMPLRRPTGFTWTGDGDNFTFVPARVEDGVIFLDITHFSGAGAGEVTLDRVEQLIAAWSTEPIDPSRAEDFYRLAVLVGDWCAKTPTCALMKDRVEAYVPTMPSGACAAVAQGGLVRDAEPLIWQALRIDALRTRLGLDEQSALRTCGEVIVGKLIDAITATTPAQPLAVSTACAGVSGDLDSDGAVREVECALYLRTLAANLGLVSSANRAGALAAQGLDAVIADGKAKCDTPSSFADGIQTLGKGQGIDAFAGLRTPAWAAASEYCTAITVTPASPTARTDEIVNFVATSKDPANTSYAWEVTGGIASIDTDGNLLTPVTPGTLTVTATANGSGRKGTAKVTVICPVGQVEFQGHCGTIMISIDPPSASVGPGDAIEFQAAVSNTEDTRVTYGTSAGSISGDGVFTAPEEAGMVTVTATSVADPTKSAAAEIQVGALTVTARTSTHQTYSKVIASTDIPSDDPEVVVDPQGQPELPWTGLELEGVRTVSVETSASAMSKAPLVQGSAAANMTASSSVSHDGGDLIFDATWNGTFNASADREMDAMNEGGALVDAFSSASDEITFTIPAARHFDCSLDPPDIPASDTWRTAGDNSSIHLIRQTPNAADIFALNPDGNLTASVDLVPGTYVLSLDMGAAASVDDGASPMLPDTFDPQQLNIQATGGASCSTSN